MKKIILTSTSCFAVLILTAQSPGAPTKSLTVAEANAMNGIALPTINGMPYTQYKAQQDALKANQSNNPYVNRPANNTNGTEPQVQKTQSLQQSNQLRQSTPAIVPVNNGITENKTINPAPVQTLSLGSGNAAGIPMNNSSVQAVNSGQNVPAGSVNGVIMPTGFDKSTQDTKPAIQPSRVPITPVQDKPVVNDNSKTGNTTTAPNPVLDKIKVTSGGSDNKPVVEVKQKN